MSEQERFESVTKEGMTITKGDIGSLDILLPELLPQKVTPELIESLITSEFYFTAGQGVLGASEMGTRPAGRADALNRYTFCTLVLKNGHVITGENGCVRASEWDPAKGQEMARKNAVDKIYALEGYLLRQRIYEEQNPA